MSSHPDHHPIRRVVLPSGRSIEVVYFAEERTGRSQATGRSTRELHRCPTCASDLVHPTAWEEAADDCWQLELRCPNCEWCTVGCYGQHAVERLEEELDAGTETLVDDLKRLMRANFEDDVERFTRALSADQILPEDF